MVVRRGLTAVWFAPTVETEPGKEGGKEGGVRFLAWDSLCSWDCWRHSFCRSLRLWPLAMFPAHTRTLGQSTLWRHRAWSAAKRMGAFDPYRSI